MGKRGPRTRRWRRGLAGLATAAAALLALQGLRLERRVEAFLAERSLPPLRVYSAPLALRPGLSPRESRLRERLVRLGYREAPQGPLAPGEFREREDRLEIALRGFRDPQRTVAPQRVRLDLAGGRIASIRSLEDGRALSQAWLEPELLGTYAGGVLGERRVLPLEAIPSRLVQAVLAIEDARFASHRGIDPIGILRASLANLRGGRIVQGGSTLTQQLAKNLFLEPDRGLWRKINEAVLALLLEARLSKREILELYLNNVYLGRAGSVGIYGVGAAARAFFGKAVQDLTLAEAAAIAGSIHAPNRDSPLRHPERARERRDRVLDRMLENGWIDGREHSAARAEPLRVREGMPPQEAPFFVDEALRRVRRMGYDPDTVRGLSVYATVDPELQRAAERILAAGLAELERRHPRLRRGPARLEGAAVILEAPSGFVRAMVGGRDFTRSQFNRVTRARRQPGSAFKPFVYLAALDDPRARVTPSTRLRDEPLRLRVGTALWSPTNYDGRYLGEVTVRAALEGSRNVPTVELARRIGLERIAEVSRACGLRGGPLVPAMALGANEVSLLELAAAYTVFPNLGEAVRPALIRGVVADDGRVLYQDRMRRVRAATAPAAFVTSHLLEGVVERGTASAARRLGLAGPVAGKTGTTNDEKDAWFVGYSPDWVAAVWVGFDDGTPVGLTGAAAALPIWVDLMKLLLSAYGERPFEVPAGVVFRDVERWSGLLATFGCGETIREAFVAGTEPVETCDGRRLAPWAVEEAEVEPPPGEDSSGEAPARPRAPSPWRDLAEALRGWFGGRR